MKNTSLIQEGVIGIKANNVSFLYNSKWLKNEQRA